MEIHDGDATVGAPNLPIDLIAPTHGEHPEGAQSDGGVHLSRKPDS